MTMVYNNNLTDAPCYCLSVASQHSQFVNCNFELVFYSFVVAQQMSQCGNILVSLFISYRQQHLYAGPHGLVVPLKGVVFVPETD